MAYSPSFVPALSPSETTSEVSTQNPAATQVQKADIAASLATLRKRLADPNTDLDAMSVAIAEAAHKLTEANAAAIAIRKDGVVTCRGRSGELSPEIGTRLSVDSGISGECLRTGKVLRCDDAFKDFRADPEVCRRLGLRAIAAVPLRGTRGTTGVLEAFSTRPYAFADEHMDALRELAELGEQARAREDAPAVAVEAPPQPSSFQRRRAMVAAAIADVRAVAAAGSRSLQVLVRERMSDLRARYAVGIAALALLLLAGLLVWKPWGGTKAMESRSAAPVPAQPAASELSTSQPTAAADTAVPAAKASLVWTPPAVAARSSSKEKISPQGTSEPADVVTKVVQPAAGEAISAAASAPDAPPADVSAGSKLVAASGSKSLGGVLAGPAMMPALAVPISSGVTDGVLVRRVPPIYPQTAIPLRLEGAVVLRATISEDGKVRDVSAVSGHPMLAHAALDAVRQWRYKPYRLNGKPVPMQTEITINFKLP
jgi:TonB family protein